MSQASDIHSILHESRTFPPPHPADVGMPRWLIPSMEQYREMYRKSIEDSTGFWEMQARSLHWIKPWTRVLDWNPPDAKWFVNGKINACDNCVDRMVKAGHGDEVAIVWEGEPMVGGHPEVRRLTYRDLLRETSKFGNVLRRDFPGWTLAMLSAQRSLEQQLRVPLESRVATRNGGIPVRLVLARLTGEKQVST